MLLCFKQSYFEFLFCKGPHSGKASSSEADDYDIAVRQLAFELKGKVSEQPADKST